MAAGGPLRRLGTIVAFILVAGAAAHAMQIVHEPLDAVLRKTDAAVIVDVLSVSAPRQEGLWRSIDLQVTVTKTLFGKQKVGRKLGCRYSEGVPHLRGTMRVSPLVSGSGVEFDVQPGRQVVLLLGAADKRSRLRDVLRIEPVERAPLVQEQHEKP